MSFIAIVFLLSFLLLQIYFWYFFSAFAFRKNEDDNNSKQPPISIVICGKNAKTEFERNLPKILHQDYKDYEIIIVDDHSTDNTASYLESLQSDYQQIKLVKKESVPNKAGKKSALYAGVKLASNEWVVVTDADCRPAGNKWLKMLSIQMIEGKDLILGLSPNEKQSGFWKGLFRYETILTAMLYISFALRKMPYMGVGRNMAFRRTLFLKEFVQILDSELASGDDDLYVNFVAKPKTTAVVIHPNSYTYSDSPTGLSNWISQKQRHLTAGFYYQFVHKVLLTLFPITQWLFLVSFFVLLFSPIKWLVILLGSFQFLTQQVINSIILQKIKEIDISLELPIYQFAWMVFQPYIALTSLFRSKQQWN